MTSRFPPLDLGIRFNDNGEGFPAFERAADAAFARVEGRAHRFSSNMASAQKELTAALALPRNLSGALDLNIPGLQEAARKAEQAAAAARELANATRLAAEAEGDYSQKARLAIGAAEAVANEYKQAAAAAKSYAAAQEQVQIQLNLTANAAARQSVVKPDNRSSLDRLLAGGAAIDRAALQARSLDDVLNRVNNSSQRAAVAAENAAIAEKKYAAALLELRQIIEPTYFAQQRLTQQIDLANQALKRGDISAEQHAQAIQLLNRQLLQNGNSVRASRFATLQAGQQFQDFFIQIQGGTSPLVAFSQQASQLAFVMSGAGGAAGKFAAFMSGPWGTAIFAGISVLSLLVATLGRSKSATDDAAKSNIDFSSSIVAATGLVGNYDKALQQLESTTRSLINTQALLIDNSRLSAQTYLAQLETQQSGLQSQIQKLQKAGAGTVVGDLADKLTGSTSRVDLARAQAELRTVQSQISSARASLAAAQTAFEARNATEAADPKAAGLAQIERERARLLERREYTLANPVPLANSPLQQISGQQFDREIQALERRKKALQDQKAPTDAAANAAARLAERGEDAAKKIANITDRFSDIPPHQEAVNRAMRELDDLANDFALKKPPNWQQFIKQIEEGRKLLGSDAVKSKPFNDALDVQREQYEIGQLILSGRQFEADALRGLLAIQQQMGPLTRGQVETYLEGAAALHDQTREYEKHQRIIANNLRLIEDQRAAVKDLVSDLLSGRGIKSIGSFFKNVLRSYTEAMAEQITQSLVGNFFDKQSDKLKGEGKLSDAGERMAGATDQMREALQRLTKATNSAADSIADVNGTVLNPANDNPITVSANQTVERTLKSGIRDIANAFLGEKAAKKLGEGIATVMQGAAYGQGAAGLILGGGSSRTGSAIGGALGNAVGKALGKTVGGALGSALGPLGSIAGGLLGGALGGLFKKTKKGSATIGADVFGNLSVLGVKGNSGSRKQAAQDSAEAVISSLEGIAEQFGAVIDASLGSVSVGVREGSYRVDPTGQGYTKTKNGAIDFGSDAQAAAEYAMLDLIKDGVLVGLRKGTQVLLQNTSDLQAGLAKALKFENVFRDLKRFKDPVGAAVDDLNREFQSLINIFKQAGATTEEMGQLEELYGIRRKEAVEQAFDSVASALKDLMNEITIGDSGYSLRTRLANAQAAFNPLAARVQAGDSTAYDAFADASRQLIEISREYYGSGTEYFALLDQVKAITQGQIDYQQRLYDSATGGNGLNFDIQPVVSATETQTQALIAELQRQGLIANDNSAKTLAALQQIAASLAGQSNPTGVAARIRGNF